MVYGAGVMTEQKSWLGHSNGRGLWGVFKGHLQELANMTFAP